MSPGNLVNKVTLLRICLGFGTLLKDANTIQFTEEGGHSEKTPGYIVQSTWGEGELDTFTEYLQKVQKDLLKSAIGKRYEFAGIFRHKQESNVF